MQKFGENQSQEKTRVHPGDAVQCQTICWWIDLKSIHSQLKSWELSSYCARIFNHSSYITFKHIILSYVYITIRHLNSGVFHIGGSENIGGASACWEWVVHKRPTPLLLWTNTRSDTNTNTTHKLVYKYNNTCIGGASACWEWVVHKRPTPPLLLSRVAIPIFNKHVQDQIKYRYCKDGKRSCSGVKQVHVHLVREAPR